MRARRVNTEARPLSIHCHLGALQVFLAIARAREGRESPQEERLRELTMDKELLGTNTEEPVRYAISSVLFDPTREKGF